MAPSTPSSLVPESPNSSSLHTLTRNFACQLCQHRKVRCDRQNPCGNCVKSGAECLRVAPSRPRRRKRKLDEKELVQRLQAYEDLLSEHGVAFESVQGTRNRTGPGAEETDGAVRENTSVAESGESPSERPGTHASTRSEAQEERIRRLRSKHDPERQSWNLVEEMTRPSSDDASDTEDGPVLHRAFDKMFDSADGFPFLAGGGHSSVTHLHPPSIRALQMWQIYITNVDPLLKIGHVPTLQSRIIEAAANPARLTKSLEALMCAIYLAAMRSSSEEDVRSRFVQDKATLTARYQGALQQALINAKFMATSDLDVLHAYMLYLICIGHGTDPREMHCLTGIAVRIATRLGLHREQGKPGLSPFEREMHRRLWWQIVAFDKRDAEMAGSTITALWSTGATTQMPSNLNDADLNPHAKEPPKPAQGATEMLFVLSRIDLVAAGGPPVGQAATEALLRFSSGRQSDDVAYAIANQSLPTDVEGYCAHVESTFLRYCDPKIPLHQMTLMMARQAEGKIRIMQFICRGRRLEDIPDADLDLLLGQVVAMLDNDSALQANEALKPFLWYTYKYFPFPAYVICLRILRIRKTGQLAAQAWKSLDANHVRRGLVRRPQNPLFTVYANLFVKAWEEHEAAETQLGHAVEMPGMITFLKQHMASGSFSGPDNGSTAGTIVDNGAGDFTPNTDQTAVPQLGPFMNMDPSFGMTPIPYFDPSTPGLTAAMGDLEAPPMNWTGYFMPGLSGYGIG
jgi:hypothetical protein